MAKTLLPHLERYSTPTSAPRASVIWLHGLGASGHDFEPLVPVLQIPSHFPVRFIFPHAPNQPVTINYGMVMPSWYDILTLSEIRKVNMEQVTTSCQYLTTFIEREIERGIPSDKIIIAGFSQGGAIAYHTALRYKKKLAGLMTLSTYLLEPEKLNGVKSEENQNIPIMIAHGKLDPVVPFSAGQRSKESLLENNYQIEWHEYPMQHEVCLEEIQDISKWIKKTLKIEAN